MSTSGTERSAEKPFNPLFTEEDLKRAAEKPITKTRKKKKVEYEIDEHGKKTNIPLDYDDIRRLNKELDFGEIESGQLAAGLVDALDLQDEQQQARDAAAKQAAETEDNPEPAAPAVKAKRDRGELLFTNSVDVAPKIAGNIKTETKPPEVKQETRPKELTMAEQAEQALARGNLTGREKQNYFHDLNYIYRGFQNDLGHLQDRIVDLKAMIAGSKNEQIRKNRQEMMDEALAEIPQLQQAIPKYAALLQRIDPDRFAKYHAAEAKGLAQAEKQKAPAARRAVVEPIPRAEPVVAAPAPEAEAPKSSELQDKLDSVERDMAEFEKLLVTDDLGRITEAYGKLEEHVNYFKNEWKSDDKKVVAELSAYWDAQNGMGKRFIEAEKAFNEKVQQLEKKPEPPAVEAVEPAPENKVQVESPAPATESKPAAAAPVKREGIDLSGLNFDYLRSDAEPVPEPVREMLKSEANQELAIIALPETERRDLAIQAETAVATAVTVELAKNDQFTEIQKEELKKLEMKDLVAAEIKNKSVFGYKIKSFLINFTAGAGAGFVARSIARRAVDFVLPGSAIVAGGVGGVAAESARFYLAERKRKKEVAAYTKTKDADIDLATRYVRLTEKLAKNPPSIGGELELLDLAAQIKAKELKNAKGGDLLKKLVAVREGAANESLRQNKDARQLFDAFKSHYSTSTDKKRLAKAALRGGLIGGAGGAVGGMIADYLHGTDPHIISAMEAGKEKITMMKGVAGSVAPDTLPMHGTVWGTAKEFLKSQSIEPSNANVLKAVGSLTEANDVDVMEWGETGRHVKDVAMQDSHQLTGFHEVLKMFGKEAVAGTAAETAEVMPGRVAAKLIDNIPPQDLDLKKIMFITGTTLGADYLWHKFNNRGKDAAKPRVNKAQKQNPIDLVPKSAGGGGGGGSAEVKRSAEETKQVKESKLFSEATSLRELYKFIKQTGGVKGSEKHYSPAELVKIISQVRKGLKSSSFITRTGGLRNRVEELIQLEKSKKRAA